jgi:hypothetical protein
MRPALRLFALAGLFLLPQRLSAQACFAAPQSPSGWVGLDMALTSVQQGLFGGEAGWRAGQTVTARAMVDRVGFDQQTPTRMRVQGGVLLRNPQWRFPACFTGSIVYTHLGELNILTLPIGVSAGWQVPLSASSKAPGTPAAAGATPAAGPALTSYIEPRVAYRRATIKGFHDVSIPFSLLGGSGISFGRMYGGLDVEWSPSESKQWAFGLRAAVGF